MCFKFSGWQSSLCTKSTHVLISNVVKQFLNRNLLAMNTKVKGYSVHQFLNRNLLAMNTKVQGYSVHRMLGG